MTNNQILGDFIGMVPGDKYEIWYMKPEVFGTLIMGDVDSIDSNNLSKTHVLMGTLGDADYDRDTEKCLGQIFYSFQSENWSPYGEANGFIASKGLKHTSMSIGDVIRIVETGDIFVCAPTGWNKIS